MWVPGIWTLCVGVHTPMYECVYMCTYSFMSVYILLCICVCIRVHTPLYECVCICVHTFMYVCACIHALMYECVHTCTYSYI